MDITSPAIRRVIGIVATEGNTVASVSDSFSKRKQVVFMKKPLSLRAHSAVSRELPELRYYRSPRTPHDPADEGFADDDTEASVSLPIAGEALRWN